MDNAQYCVKRHPSYIDYEVKKIHKKKAKIIWKPFLLYQIKQND